ncbi:MAG: nucleoside deaminase [Blastocatellia bacterium]
MNERDVEFLRAAFAAARRARERGNTPFGAILVSENGEILLEAENTENTNRDCTGHAETNLVREASQQFDQAALAKCSLYSSAEPCAMCAGAIFWSGIGRVVYGLSSSRINALALDNSPHLLLPCGDVFAAGHRAIELEGPALEEEAEIAFKGQ